MTGRSELDNCVLQWVQNPLPLTERPFRALAQQAGCSEADAIAAIRRLKEQGYIRRYRAQLDYKRLGRVATLVTASVPTEKLDAVAAAVSALEGVSHNYLRNHKFNLWFTCQDESFERIEAILGKLTQQTGVEFRALPAETVYKLDVRFDPEGPSAKDFLAGEYQPVGEPGGVVELTADQRQALRLLQDDIVLTQSPLSPDLLKIAQELSDKGVIRRIAAVLDHRKLGYTVNVMLAAVVEKARMDAAGKAMASCAAVSHCYQRKTFAGWPYNLFAMIHAGRMEDVQRFIDELAEEYRICDYALLPTVCEFKKKPVFYS
jgi:DNA-binding Lrp family transcriptional regulator